MPGALFNYSFSLLSANAWEILQKTVYRNPFFKMPEQALHRNPAAFENRLAKLNVLINCDIMSNGLH